MKYFSFFSDVAPRIRELRLKLKLSQEEFVDQLDVSQRMLSDYENAIREIPLSLVLDISEKYKVEPSFILFGSTQGDINTSNSSGKKYATGTGNNPYVFHISENNAGYNNENEIIKTENERLKSELKKAERIIELLEKK